MKRLDLDKIRSLTALLREFVIENEAVSMILIDNDESKVLLDSEAFLDTFQDFDVEDMSKNKMFSHDFYLSSKVGGVIFETWESEDPRKTKKTAS